MRVSNASPEFRAVGDADDVDLAIGGVCIYVRIYEFLCVCLWVMLRLSSEL